VSRRVAFALALVAACGGKKGEDPGPATASGTAAAVDPQAALAAVAEAAAAGTPSPSAAAYDGAARVHRVLLGDAAYADALPAEWRATAPAEVELVAVFGETELFTVDSAAYQGSNALAPATRVSREIQARRVRLVEARSGRTLADDYVIGGQPRDLRSIEGSTIVKGPDVTGADVKAWLEPFVTGASRATIVARTPNAPSTIALSPDGARLAVSAPDSKVVVYKLPGLEVERTLALRDVSSADHTVWPVPAFDPTGAVLAVGGDEGRMALWDAATGAERAELPLAKTGMGYGYDAFGVCIAGNRMLVRSREEGGWRVLAMDAGGKQVGKVGADRVAASTCAVSPTGTHAAVAFAPVAVNLVDARTWKASTILHRAAGDSVDSFAFSPDGTALVVGFASGQIQRYPADVAAAKREKLDQPHPARAPLATLTTGVSSLAFTPDGTQLLAADVEGIHLLDAATGAGVALLSRLPRALDLAVTRDGTLAVGTMGFAVGQRWAFVMRLSAAGR
jgi:hypothetical protein